MTECETCGLPPDLCVCGDLSGERKLTVGTVEDGEAPRVVVWGFEASMTVNDDESAAALASHLADSLGAVVERTADRLSVVGASASAVRTAVDASEEFRAADAAELPTDLQLADVETVDRARREACEEADLARMTARGHPEKLRPLLAFDDPETNRNVAEAIVHSGGGPIDVIAACLSAVDGDSQRALTRRRETLLTLRRELAVADGVDDPGSVAREVDRYLDDSDTACRLFATKAVAALASLDPGSVRSAVDIGTLADRLTEEQVGEAAADALAGLGDAETADRLAARRADQPEDSAARARLDEVIARIRDGG